MVDGGAEGGVKEGGNQIFKVVRGIKGKVEGIGNSEKDMGPQNNNYFTEQ